MCGLILALCGLFGFVVFVGWLLCVVCCCALLVLLLVLLIGGMFLLLVVPFSSSFSCFFFFFFCSPIFVKRVFSEELLGLMLGLFLFMPMMAAGTYVEADVFFEGSFGVDLYWGCWGFCWICQGWC